MSRSHGTPGGERPTLERDEARLVARIRAEWAPEPLDAIERTAFDARLAERLERTRRRVGLWPALGAGLAAAGLAALLVLRQQGEPLEGPPPVVAQAPAPAARGAWAADLLYDDDADAEDDALDEGLPAEYAAIAGVFLDR